MRKGASRPAPMHSCNAGSRPSSVRLHAGGPERHSWQLTSLTGSLVLFACYLFACCLTAVCLLLLALGVVEWQPLAQFIDAGGLLRGQGGNHLPQFQTWLKQEHGKELPLPRVGAKMEIDKKVYSKGVRILDREDIA